MPPPVLQLVAVVSRPDANKHKSLWPCWNPRCKSRGASSNDISNFFQAKSMVKKQCLHPVTWVCVLWNMFHSSHLLLLPFFSHSLAPFGTLSLTERAWPEERPFRVRWPRQEPPRQEPQLSPITRRFQDHKQLVNSEIQKRKKLWLVFQPLEHEWKWQVSSCRLSTKNDTSGSAAGASGIWRD